MTDPFLYDDAAYVLGALEPEERAEFERHLETCPDCLDRVRDARSLLPALATVPAAALEPVPETLLPGLLRRASADRRRRRIGWSALVAAVAACAAAITVALLPSTSTPAPRSVPMAAVFTGVPVRADAAVVAKPWGTEIELHCWYVGEPPPTAYVLQVRDRSGHKERLGTWRLVPGHETQYASGTALRPNQISRVEIALPDGRPVLRLNL
jgi:anti-sigma factor RsiW